MACLYGKKAPRAAQGASEQPFVRLNAGVTGEDIGNQEKEQRCG
jgi:hypothetical protein